MIFTCVKCHKEFASHRAVKGIDRMYCSRTCWYTRNLTIPGASYREAVRLFSCETCGREVRKDLYAATRNKRFFCSKTCFVARKRPRRLSVNGYLCIGKTPEHILIAAKALGRKLTRYEVVHHINGNKTDNRNTNLLICSNRYHSELHQRMSRLYQQEHFS